ncbi:alpha/beta hydrolase [Conexibacter sp. DBS9H8]|uniref:alpha/beta hydrolase n=1 Tax=Conexibacter sp. DBS9H8 TaxID=2937801 RepID=UPI0020106308|nr:alpha/beta hydrolase [Conexibacter sp. DBS9H8]
MTRSDSHFLSDGTSCAAWIYRPDGDGPHPILVMAHGFSATREQRLDAFAERFAAAGIGVLLFDYRHFGASAGEPRQLLDIHRQQADFHAGIAHARSLDWVDPDRVGLFGSSFSGGHVIEVAAADPSIAAIVSQCPFTDGFASLPILGAANIVRGAVVGLWDQLSALRGGQTHYIATVGPPGSFAVITTLDSEAGFAAITPANSTWVNRVAGRIALWVGLYRPGRAAARLRCPSLFCVCDRDSVAPAERTVALVSAAPRGEIKRYPVGHFDVYVGEPFERAVADQIAFLQRILRPGARAAASGPASEATAV